MKSVLISIQPKWCELIANGKKTVEVRKTRSKIDTPFKCYIYCTKQKVNGEILLTYDKNVVGRNRGFRGEGDIPLAGKVIGEFVCKKIDKIVNRGIHNNFYYCYCSLDVFGNDDIETEITAISKSCISKEELNYYGMYSHCLYAWHISDLVIYDKPKELSEFVTICVNDCLNPYKCDKCEYNYTESLEIGTYEECCCNNLKPLKRPPQSWCYVEQNNFKE